MDPLLAAAAALAGYLIGSIQFARIIFARLRPGTEPDLIRTPSFDGEVELVAHHVSSTSVMIAFGPRWGVLTMVLDATKAFVPVLALELLFPDQPYSLVCGVAVLVGHIWPVWYRFSGGGGNACIMGLLLAIDPLALLVTHAAGMVIGRFVPLLAFMSGVMLTIPWSVWRERLGSPEVLFAVAITVVYIGGEWHELLEIVRLRREGHKLDIGHTMRLMKGTARTGRTGAEVAEEQRAERES